MWKYGTVLDRKVKVQEVIVRLYNFFPAKVLTGMTIFMSHNLSQMHYYYYYCRHWRLRTLLLYPITAAITPEKIRIYFIHINGPTALSFATPRWRRRWHLTGYWNTELSCSENWTTATPLALNSLYFTKQRDPVDDILHAFMLFVEKENKVTLKSSMLYISEKMLNKNIKTPQTLTSSSCRVASKLRSAFFSRPFESSTLRHVCMLFSQGI